MSKIFTMSVSKVYPLYLQKLQRKGRTKTELDTVITWLTGFSEADVAQHVAVGTTFEDFFAAASLNPNAAKITGGIGGGRVEEAADPVMRQSRYRAKPVDALARGKPL